MTYPFTEHATVLEGEVELTVAGGEPQRFAPGDSWFVKQGTEVEWKILTPRFVKHYRRTSRPANKLIMPGGALRLPGYQIAQRCSPGKRQRHRGLRPN